MSIGVIIALIILGIICIILEILVVPGGVVGIVGFLMMAGGVVVAYLQHGALVGNITMIATVLVTIIGIVYILRSKSWRKLVLETKIESKMNEVDHSKLGVGIEGIAVSRLAPSGKGKFGDEIVEVASSHDFIDVNSEIVITKIEGNKIIVKLK